MTSTPLDETASFSSTTRAMPEFSTRATQRLEAEFEEYRAVLRTQAIDLAAHEDADNVSERHVRVSAERLVARRRSATASLLGTCGGVLLGATGSLWIQALRTPLTPSETSVAILACCFGTALVVVQWFHNRA